MKNNPWKSGSKFLFIAIIIFTFFILLGIIFSCSNVYDVNHYRSKGFREQKTFIQKTDTTTYKKTI